MLLTREMKIFAFLLLFFIGLATSSCPGCPIEASIDDLDTNLADSLKKLTTASVLKLENSNCDFEIVSISNFKSQVSKNELFVAFF